MADDMIERASRRIASRRDMFKWAGAGGLGVGAMELLAACGGGGGSSSDEGGVGQFPKTPKWNFVFVNHVTTNTFFVPTQYGIQDAAALLNVNSQWTGSETSKAAEMVNAMNNAISGGADGIAVSLVDPTAFIGPTKEALKKGIPVIAYNANSTKTPALTYVGQDLYESGVEMGKRIVDEVGSGDVAIFIATPGQLNIQPRSDGARDAIKQSGKPIKAHQIATGAKIADELSAVESFYIGHKSFKGLYAVDAGSTQAVAQVMDKYKLKDKGVHGGGFDLLDKTVTLLSQGVIDFTINQEPYMQGFLPMLYLYLFKLSGTILAPPFTNTGLVFLTEKTVKPFADSQSRFEGDTKKQKWLKHEGAIPIPV
ncbi:MAG: substrate-binding domain-containing protein [Streptosporangiaceae bacterium]